MEDENIQDMIMAISCKHFEDNDSREEFENEMWEFTTRIMQMFRNFERETNQQPYNPENVKHG